MFIILVSILSFSSFASGTQFNSIEQFNSYDKLEAPFNNSEEFKTSDIKNKVWIGRCYNIDEAKNEKNILALRLKEKFNAVGDSQFYVLSTYLSLNSYYTQSDIQKVRRTKVSAPIHRSGGTNTLAWDIQYRDLDYFFYLRKFDGILIKESYDRTTWQDYRVIPIPFERCYYY